VNDKKRSKNSIGFFPYSIDLFVFKRPICSKLNADSEYVIKNGLFYYLAVHLIDLLDMQKYAFA